MKLTKSQNRALVTLALLGGEVAAIDISLSNIFEGVEELIENGFISKVETEICYIQTVVYILSPKGWKVVESLGGEVIAKTVMEFSKK